MVMRSTEQSAGGLADEALGEERLAAAAERRRGRTFRRTIVGFVSCIVLLLGVRVWWGFESGRRLRNEIASIRDRGEPLLVDDFNPSGMIPEEENAAILYEKASAALVEAESGTLSLADFCGDPRVCDAYPRDARAIVELNAESLRLLREARSLSKVDWNMRFTSPLINFMLPNLSSQRNLAKFGRSVAHVQFRFGEHAAAIETVRDMVKFGEDISGTQRASVITHLVAIACEALAIQPLETFTHELAVSSGNPGRKTAPAKSAATRAQVEALIRELLDEESLWRGRKYGMQAERATQLDTIQAFVAGKLSMGGVVGGPASLPTLLRVAVRPVLESDGLYMLQRMSEVVQGTTLRNWPAVSVIVDREEQEQWIAQDRVSLRGAIHILSRIFLPSLSRAHLLHFRMIASRRMAAIALAIRLFELERGRRPVELAELVPGYLAELPVDPFAGDGRTFGYKPNAERPVLYSISDDERDDGGEYELKTNGNVDWNQKDLVYFLNGDRPFGPPATPISTTAPSGQAVEDYSEEDVGQGDAEQGEEAGEKP